VLRNSVLEKEKRRFFEIAADEYLKNSTKNFGGRSLRPPFYFAGQLLLFLLG
jgi:hypothetical protein